MIRSKGKSVYRELQTEKYMYTGNPEYVPIKIQVLSCWDLEEQ